MKDGNHDVLIIKDLSKKFSDRQLFNDVSMEVLKQERVFIIGPNGCGKTTLLNIIQNKIKPDSGSFHIGSNMKVAYYSQSQEIFSENKTILDFVWNRFPSLIQTEVRKALAIFLFKGEDVDKNVLTLSGGEKARLSLLLIMLSDANFLILDEPTNHLDINAREALERALSEYEGTLLIVSHDRYFINKLSTKIYRLDLYGVKKYDGNYNDYILQYKPKELVKEKAESTNKIAYKEKKEREALERKKKNMIIKIEEEISSLEDKSKQLGNELLLEENASDYEKAMEITNRINEIEKQLNELYTKWEELIKE